MYKLLVSIIFLFSGSVYGQVYSERGVIDLIKRDLSVTTKSLTREVRGYHWFNSNVGTKKMSLDDSFFKEQFLHAAKPFWTFNPIQDHNVGPGFYAAPDPGISERYGNTMIEVIIPAGTRFIDMRGGAFDTQLEISNETQAAMNTYCRGAGQVLPNYPDVFKIEIDGQVKTFQSFFKQTLTYDISCYKMFSQAVRELNVEFLAYGWGPYNNLQNGCEKSILSSFVMLGVVKKFKKDTAVLSMGSVKVRGYTQKLGKRPKSKKLESYRFVDRFTRTVRGKKAKWSYFDNQRVSTNDIENIKRVAFDCQSSVYTEEAVPQFIK